MRFSRCVSIVDGYFVPNKAGNYYLEYIATDDFGNQSKEIVYVNVLDDRTQAFNLSLVGEQEIAKAGKEVTVKDYEITGEFGSVDVKITATNINETIVIDTETKKFVPHYAGEYLIVYSYGRGQIIAHIGAGHFDETMELLDHANNMDIQAVSSLPPSLMGYYSSNEIVDYYKTLAKNSKHPVYVYINPYVASVLSANLVGFAKEMANIDNVVGLKISIADYYAFGKITASVGDKLNILNGPDECMICGLSVGADGAIGTTYNIAPKLAVEIYNKYKQNDMAGALTAQRKLNQIIGLALGVNISRWKDIMKLMGFDMGHTIYPARLQTKEEIQQLKEDLEKINFFEMIK